MVIADRRGGFIAGLVVEIVLLSLCAVALALDAPIGLFVFAALVWGALLALWLGFRVRLLADASGLHGLVGFQRVDLRWDDVEQLLPAYQGMWLVMRDGTRRTIRLPNLDVYAAIARLTQLREGKGERAPTLEERWRLPDGVSTQLALHRGVSGELLKVNVLLSGRDPAALGTAARVLAVRAADEHRWDATFSGEIELQLMRTPESPKLSAEMDEALARARDELAARGWTVVGGRPFVLSWKRLTP